MTDATVAEVEEPKKRSKLPLILGVVLALAGGGGGFFAVSSGLILGADDHAEVEVAEADPLPQVAFVPMDPLLIGLPPGASARYLRFTGQLEVKTDKVADVQAMMPRIVDVLNDYLRLVSVADLQDPSRLLMIRAQMLRRVQLVVGDGRVKDLLIMEFLLD